MARNVYEAMFVLDSTRFSRDPDGTSGEVVELMKKAGGEILVSRLWEERRLGLHHQRPAQRHLLADVREPGCPASGRLAPAARDHRIAAAVFAVEDRPADCRCAGGPRPSGPDSNCGPTRRAGGRGRRSRVEELEVAENEEESPIAPNRRRQHPGHGEALR